MAKADSIQQGESYDFLITIEGDDIADFSYVLDVKKYPHDTSLLNKNLTLIQGNKVFGQITPTESDAFPVGLLRLIVSSSDPDETIKQLKRLEITRKWI